MKKEIYVKEKETLNRKGNCNRKKEKGKHDKRKGKGKRNKKKLPNMI